MANIHGIHEFRNNPPAQQQRYQGGSGTTGGGSIASRPGYVQHSDPSILNPHAGISLMQPPPSPTGGQPGLCAMIFPRMEWKAATTVITLIDVIMFIITLIVGGAKYDGAFVKGNDMGGPSAITLRAMGGKFGPDIRADGEVWRLLVPIILHSGLLHLFSNVFIQLRMGYTLELRWGWIKYVIIYILTGISANLWSSVLSYNVISVGASGALFGIIGADIAYLAYNWVEIPDNTREACFLAIITFVTFMLGLGSGIDNYAHLGGLISGLFIGLWLPAPVVKREKENYFRAAGAIGFWGLFLLFVLLLFVGKPAGWGWYNGK